MLNKVLTEPTHPTAPNCFLVSNERYAKNKNYLLQYYDIQFAPIKRYYQFGLQAFIFSLLSIYNVGLSVCTNVCHSFLLSIWQSQLTKTFCHKS